ncbi:MAG: PfaD family polyunsaturated fatty acid/polyketide biosynthesis protein [Alphaproteobacteria bacterium]|nr:PfaD family polyunsaturated fatty acid/polyketide biosynthesis protein [Alphaproteobacteria bacterium]
MRAAWKGGPAYEERFFVEAPPAAVSAPRARDLAALLHDLAQPLYVDADGAVGTRLPASLRGVVPARPIGSLGAASFRQAHGVRAAYVAGAMAGGIASEELVLAMAHSGLLSFFGAGGLPLPRVQQALDRLSREAAGRPWGMNLLHNPVEPAVEAETVQRYLDAGVRTISASAFMGLTPAVVRFRFAGVREQGGQVVTDQRVFAKVSRPETAAAFMGPPTDSILAELVAAGHLTAGQAKLAATLPVANDITLEGDSGGHTDRRPLVAMLPVVLRLRDRLAAEHGFTLRVGAAGGLGDPTSLRGALAMGADYVLTGSVNQATVEAGTSDMVKELLAQAAVVDVATGAAPDMFELGAHVQVLSRGTMYAQRSKQLHELWRSHAGIDDLPPAVRAKLEKQVFQRSLDDVWTETRAFWQQQDPAQVTRADADPRHRMALCFRWYLGLSSRWARAGAAERKRDFQVWCGPAMGLFNDWVAGSWLEPLSARTVVAVADALLHGAAVAERARGLAELGVAVPDVSRPWRA